MSLSEDWPSSAQPRSGGHFPSAGVALGHDAAADSTPKSWIVATGVSCIAAYIAYATYRSCQSTEPQVFFGKGDLCPELAAVNFDPTTRSFWEEALSPWMDTKSDIHLTFPKVCFYEEDDQYTPEALPSVVNCAARYAHRELASMAGRNNSEGGPTPACVVYRSAIKVDDGKVELLESSARTLHGVDGRHFWERHVLGFTVTGRAVEVFTYDVRGVLDASRAATRWPAEALEAVSFVEILRHCCVPSKTSFLPSARRVHSLFVSEASSSAPSRDDTTPLRQSGVSEDLLTRCWRSPLPLFRQLAAALRHSDRRLGGYRKLLQVYQTTKVTIPPLPWVFPWTTRAAAPTADDYVRQFGGHFFIVWRVSGDTTRLTEADLSGQAVRIVEHYVGKGQLPASRPPLLYYGQAGVLCDLGSIEPVCSVLHADRIAWDLTGILVSAGLLVYNVRLALRIAEGPTGSQLLPGRCGGLHMAPSNRLFVCSSGGWGPAEVLAVLVPPSPVRAKDASEQDLYVVMDALLSP